MASKKKKATDEHTVDAWVADKEAAQQITSDDLDEVQKRFKGRLSINRMSDGRIAIYPDHPGGECAEFTAFMTASLLFNRRELDLRLI